MRRQGLNNTAFEIGLRTTLVVTSNASRFTKLSEANSNPEQYIVFHMSSRASHAPLTQSRVSVCNMSDTIDTRRISLFCWGVDHGRRKGDAR